MASSRSHDGGIKSCIGERFEGRVSRCVGVFIKVDVPTLSDAASLWISDLVRFTFLAIATHCPFSGRGFELSGVLDVPEGLDPMTERCDRSIVPP